MSKAVAAAAKAGEGRSRRRSPAGSPIMDCRASTALRERAGKTTAVGEPVSESQVLLRE